MKTKIGILGGAFDPIHIDHLNTAKAVLDAGLVTHVWIMPCWNHRFGKDVVSFEHRCAMVEIAIKEFGDERITCHRFEGNIQNDGSTYNMLTTLKKRNRLDSGEFPFVYITGLDNAYIITRWHEWEKLIKEFEFIVVRRAGCQLTYDNAWYHNAPHIYLDSGDKIGTVSSTQIRANIANDIYNFGTLDVVADYIRKHNLYKIAPY